MSKTGSFDAWARQWLRALRGKRSQQWLSRRLGYRSNVLYRWEAGTRQPTMTELFALATAVGIDVPRALESFERTSYLRCRDEILAGRVGGYLQALAAPHTVVRLAATSGLSRFAIARRFAGEAEPKVGDFLCLLEAATGRALDFVGCFTDPARLPSAQPAWARVQAYRRLAYESQYSEAVLALLESDAYRRLDHHPSGWVAKRLRISLGEEQRTLQALAAAGVITKRRGRWVARPDRYVDTRRDPAAFERLKSFWAKHAAERLARDRGNLCAYVIGTVAQADLDRVLDSYLETYETSRQAIRGSGRAERAVLITVQVTSLDSRAVRAHGNASTKKPKPSTPRSPR